MTHHITISTAERPGLSKVGNVLDWIHLITRRDNVHTLASRYSSRIVQL